MAETTNSGPRLVFIGGSARSGTTLVQNMLDSHPLILGGPEFLHLPDIIGLRRKLHASINRGWIDLICTRDDVDRHLTSLIEKLFLSLADKYKCEFYSEKTPENILFFSELIEVFPEAHFIQVIRDPRAISSSMEQVKQRAIDKGLKPPFFTLNTSTRVDYIKRCFNAGLNASKQTPEKVLTIVYEHLLANPEEDSKKICNFLGVEWNDHMLRPGDKEHLGSHAITTKSNEIWYDSKTYNQNLSIQNTEKWKNKLSLAQQVKVTMAFMDNQELIRFGYDFSLESLSHGRGILSQMAIYCLLAGSKIYKLIVFVLRKIPGSSSLKNGLLSTARFFRIPI